MDWAQRFRRGQAESIESPETPEEVVQRLLGGNAHFISLTVPDIAAPSTVQGALAAVVGTAAAAPKQSPFAIVLGCSDARVPLELVFDAQPNQLFVVRVAGNVLGDECLGSIEYALYNFKSSVHLLVVLGHTGCGAVAATVDTYLDPHNHNSIAFTRSLRSLVNHILLPVHGAALSLAEAWGRDVVDDPGYRAALIETAVYLNAGSTAFQLQEQIHASETLGTRVVFAVFDIATCRVIGPDLDPDTDDTSKLAPAPSTPDDLILLGQQIATSPMVQRHLFKDRKLRSAVGG